VTSRRTEELCRIALPDAARLREEDADYANRKGFSEHRPARSLYTREDAAAVLERFRAVEFGRPVEVAEGPRATFRPAGHIPGSASISVDDEGPVSASGMATGGRVLHHLARLLPDPRNAVILVGYQAEQTRGRLLLEGARLFKMLGRYVPVRAEIVDFMELSVHAERNEVLAWLQAAQGPPETLHVVHGEPQAAAALRDAALREPGWPAVVPRLHERVRVG
jgi:Cft2 family RNA processing exonuclease